MAMENIHNHTYGLMIETFIESSRERNFLFNSIKNIPTMKRIADWSLKWINDDDPFYKRLYAFSLLEGVFF